MAVTVSPPGLRKAGEDASSRLKNVYGVRLLVGEKSTMPLVFLATLIGLAVRTYFVLGGSGMPLNDGGMFYSMAEDIRQAHYALPAFTSYNGGEIPFAYPPLGFYFAAALADVSSWSMLDILRFLPLAASALTIPAVYLLANAILNDRRTAVLATFFFALAPRTYEWEIAGGGLTRSFGFLFAILAVYHLYRLTQKPSPGRGAVSAVLTAATAMSHLEMVLFVAISYFVILAFYGRTVRHLGYAAAVTCATVVLAAPWWGSVIATHGLEPFLAAMHTGRHSPFVFIQVIGFGFTGEPLFPLIMAVGLLGLFACLGQRQWFLPIWLMGILFLDPRKGATEGMVPLVMLAAIATFTVLIPQFERLSAGSGRWSTAASNSLAGIIPTALVLYLFYAAPFADIRAGSPLISMPLDETQAMRWAAEHTPENSRFIILDAPLERGWPLDTVLEWFPALTRRVSVSTVQGTEWLPGDRGMVASMNRYNYLKLCSDKTVGCLADWALKYRVSFDYVYVGKALPDEAVLGSPPQRDCCSSLRASLNASPDYRLIYDGPRSQVFERLSPSSAAR